MKKQQKTNPARPVRNKTSKGGQGRKPDFAKGRTATNDSRPRTSYKSSNGGRTATRKRTQESKDQGILPNVPTRLNKVIADGGVASRRAADAMILAGDVTINGEICTQPGTMVSISDVVSVRGEAVSRYKHLTYILLNKPKDTITTSNDELGRKTVFDIVRLHTRLFSVGRLDRNTTGVMLLTNDGDLANRMMHPRYMVPRSYRALLDKGLSERDARSIAEGVELDDGPTAPSELVISPQNRHIVHIRLHEGRNHEVRRIFEFLGYTVRQLERKEYAFLTIRGLKRGEYRHLSKEEVAALREYVGLSKRT